MAQNEIEKIDTEFKRIVGADLTRIRSSKLTSIMMLSVLTILITVATVYYFMKKRNKKHEESKKSGRKEESKKPEKPAGSANVMITSDS